MSIQSEITRIASAKAAMQTYLVENGVELTGDETIDQLSAMLAEVAERLPLTGGTMTGQIIAAPETTGAACVRNIAYGTSLPSTVAEGTLFILVEE